MLDIGWTELLLIAVVAVVVIGPKELPEALRTLGRTLNKLRRMAGEFQGQFNQALREANLEDVKKDFDDIRQSASMLKGGLSPIDIARNQIGSAAIGAATATAAASSTPAAPAPTIDTSLTSSAAAAEPAAPAAEHAAEPLPSAFATSPTFRK